MNRMSKEDSYAERRKVFKDIWDTAMQMDEKDADNIMNKPKVIKTLRLDEVDKCVIGKGKKEKIRTLRTVCKKILDFCDRQDEDDRFYEQIAERKELRQHKLELKNKKTKFHRGRKKVKKSKSLFSPLRSVGDPTSPDTTTSERKSGYSKQILSTTRKDSLSKIKRPTVVRRTLVRHKISKVKSAITGGNNAGTSRRKIIKKKRSKRKKSSDGTTAPAKPSGASSNVRYVSAPTTGHAIVRRIKQLLTDNKIAVTEQNSK